MHPPRGALYSKARLACRYSTPGSLALRYVWPMSQRPERTFDAILFDLLTALLDSWTLWNIVAGSPENGRKWRVAYLRRTYETGAYRRYETLVAEAAAEVGLFPTLAAQLAARYGELKPWPEGREVLGALRRDGVVLGSVTNCSEELGPKAFACTGVEFDVVVTAERAGYYKPDPRPYQ